MERRYYFVYIVTNKKKTTLYIGVTNNLFSHPWRIRLLA